MEGRWGEGQSVYFLFTLTFLHPPIQHSLYVDVTTTLATLAATPWASAADAAASTADAASALQSGVATLPKAAREWPAYARCRRLVDDLVDALPLVARLAHKSMRDR